MEEGPGFPFFLPKGMILKNKLIDYWRQIHKAYGYLEISTPIILNRKLWERSGHWDHYKKNMYTTVIDDEDFAIKPMNCPGGMLVYKNGDALLQGPALRMGELGLVHRHELSGALHGLFRVRCFTQDDAHIFMTWEQMKDEIKNVVRLFDEVYSAPLALSITLSFPPMPEDHIGDQGGLGFRTETLQGGHHRARQGLCRQRGRRRILRPQAGLPPCGLSRRTWQCGTIQLDIQLPERFEFEYTVGADGESTVPL